MRSSAVERVFFAMRLTDLRRGSAKFSVRLEATSPLTEVLVGGVTANEITTLRRLLRDLKDDLLLDIDLVVLHILLELIYQHVERVHRLIQRPNLLITIQLLFEHLC